MDEMLQYTTTDRIPMTYFDAERTRTDPIVALNLLRFFYSRGRGHELSHTLDWVLALLRVTLDPNLHARLARLLRARIAERTDAASGDALAGSVVGLRLAHGLALLLPLQCEAHAGYTSMARLASRIGNRGLTTALALNAISATATATRAVVDLGEARAGARGPSIVAAASLATLHSFMSDYTSIHCPDLPPEAAHCQCGFPDKSFYHLIYDCPLFAAQRHYHLFSSRRPESTEPLDLFTGEGDVTHDFCLFLQSSGAAS
ncbi:hypothetical protein EDB85DRAFT_2147711 [Lactarius pseudohatsudake]|nr:hypothetical protein EDB85DRAFT_2147711 [Lactarius pseudohatsudake]